MLAYLRVPWAFLVRDFREDSSYKIGFLFRVVQSHYSPEDGFRSKQGRMPGNS